MKVINQERLENNVLSFSLRVEAEEFDRDLDQVYRKKSKQFSIHGFRPGKAPRRIIERMYGAELFYNDAINEYGGEYYLKALNELEADEIGQPTISLVEASRDGYTLDVKVPVAPEAVVKEYRGLRAPLVVPPVTDERVDAVMQDYVNRATRVISVDREAAMGDVVVLDFTGYLDGEPFEGGDAKGASILLGQGGLVPGFEEQLVGVKAEEEREISVTFPENYPDPKLAGRETVFRTKIHTVQERQVPEMDDELAKDVSEYDTLAELRESVVRQETERAEHRAREEFEGLIRAALLRNTEVEIPASMIDQELPYVRNNFLQQNQYLSMIYQLSEKDAMRMQGVDPDHLEDAMRPRTEQDLKMRLALDAVARSEGLEATEEEMEAEYKTLADESGKSVEELKKNGSVVRVRGIILRRKAERLVLDAAVPMTAEELKQEQAAEAAPEGAAPEAAAEAAPEGEAAPEAAAEAAAEAAPEGEAAPEAAAEAAPEAAPEGETAPEAAPEAEQEIPAFEAPAAE